MKRKKPVQHNYSEVKYIKQQSQSQRLSPNIVEVVEALHVLG